MRPLRNIFLGIFILLASVATAANIKVTGTGEGTDKKEAINAAFINARVQMMNEITKILLYWSEFSYADKGYNFDKISRRVSQMPIPYITKEKITKKKGKYLVSVSLTIGSTDKSITSQILEYFETNMTPANLKKINYNHDQAYEVLYKIISQW